MRASIELGSQIILVRMDKTNSSISIWSAFSSITDYFVKVIA